MDPNDKPPPRATYTSKQISYLRSEGALLEATPHYYNVRAWALAPPCIRGQKLLGNSHYSGEDKYMIIPRDRDGLAALLYLGFERITAREIWDDYCRISHMLPEYRRSLIANVIEHLECEFADAGGNDSGPGARPVDFRAFTKSAGLTRKTRLWISGSAPRVDEARDGDKMLLRWLKYEVRQRYLVLESAGKYARMHQQGRDFAHWMKPEWYNEEAMKGRRGRVTIR